MDILKAMKERHSVRAYKDQPITGATLERLKAMVDKANADSGLHIQLVLNEPKAFDSRMAHYGKFSGVKNYLALIGKRDGDLDEKCGYYGEQIVLLAQTLGLNTCWVALTYKKIPDAFRIAKGEKLYIVISVGYGATQGKPHPSKSAETLGGVNADSPAWYRAGIEAAMLAPTAINQQKFRFTLTGDVVTAKALLGTPQTKIDLGIAKCHFEIGSGYRF